MNVFAISDLHLSFGANKPMEVFGGQWTNYLDKIVESWNKNVKENDIVLIAGDISWAMKLEETKEDFEFLEKLKGIKILTRGNHDFWWASISAVRGVAPKNVFALQNDAIKFGEYIICGTRGWTVPEDAFETEHDEKIFKREVIRLEMSLEASKRLQTNGEKIICMVHFPPFNSKREDSEFTRLFEKFGVSKVVYWHLHGNKVRANLFYKKNDVEYFLTACDQTENNVVLID
ncbi:MAG: metallophosphoesterase [Clostridia bacterium]|nr:metallophosphoesterase [Clostridia bacterium]